MHNSTKIRELNDKARKTLSGIKIMATPSVAALPGFADILEKVRRYNEFEVANDLYGERDLGIFKHKSDELLWKIDYYNLDLTEGSPDPADETVTRRILTVMLIDEY